ncbi:hypothetical protein Tco_1543040 [Tanacetum coccineum]
MGYDGEIDDMLRIRARKAESEEDVFTLLAWIKAFNINEPIYSEPCHEFYSTYEFDEVCVDDELQSKKIIKFRLGGRAYRGLRNDDNFNAQDYWLSISREDNLRQLGTISLGDCEMDEEEMSWDLERESNLMWDLDIITLKDLIDSDGKFILEDPQLGVPRVGIPRPPRASMQDLYDRMHMAGVYSVAVQGAYNPPGYAQPQYDQYYQQYPPLPPPQQQQDDDE